MTSFWVTLARHKQTRSYKLLKQNEMDVLVPEKHEKTLIFLHGAANQAAMYHNLFLSSYSPVCQNTKILLPQAPMRHITFSQKQLKMPSWYDIYSEDRTNKRPQDLYNLNELETSVNRIQEIMKKEQSILQDKQQLYVGGISQGCALALYSGLSYQQKIGGIIALSGYYIDTCQISKENIDVPIYFSHGLDDQIVKIEYMQQTIKFLQYINPNFKIEYEPGLGHSIGQNQMQKIQKWYQQISKSQSH
ncbi:hypothetical protein ABPG74_022205 [Tetrahymena malaccensis]